MKYDKNCSCRRFSACPDHSGKHRAPRADDTAKERGSGHGTDAATSPVASPKTSPATCARAVKGRKALFTIGLVAAVCCLASVTSVDVPPAVPPPAPTVPMGVFLASDARGTARLPQFESWLGSEVSVGRTYIPGDSWNSILGPDFILGPWTQWLSAKPGRMLALNVPMITPNESHMSSGMVATLLREGAGGAFDLLFQRLAGKLVAEGAAETVLVLGWEMNGATYSSRCAPDPDSWKRYWRRIVTAMRSVPGQRFRFDFAPSRGHDLIPWTDCYPGDDVVDIIGMDSYDQPPGHNFDDYVTQPYGLQDQADFAAAHGKPLSYPEWGLFRYGDRPGYVTEMLNWISTHNVAYHSISDYCPHGVWTCPSNSRSSQVFRSTLAARLSLVPPTVLPSPTPLRLPVPPVPWNAPMLLPAAPPAAAPPAPAPMVPEPLPTPAVPAAVPWPAFSPAGTPMTVPSAPSAVTPAAPSGVTPAAPSVLVPAVPSGEPTRLEPSPRPNVAPRPPARSALLIPASTSV